ncbi:biofilm development regulator YmgB/AriR family protein [Kosakonia cowanii]|uniref:biofilm development regulator YmgB/AriR family protein n=1 Tax=Kosakonia cowanii TaxID=208223 RepID=UPI0023F89E26|nr:biofilm development regulator YmgB/AriR family protein [Kosakonia cowanii]MDF7760724.1 biofilm development regulator YmgB/AriR family protein [Kosakonia cowanii]
MQTTIAEEQLNAFFGVNVDVDEAEKQVINTILANLRLQQRDVAHKHLILALVRLLETEDDSAMLEIYRKALERVVQKRPDDR